MIKDVLAGSLRSSWASFLLSFLWLHRVERGMELKRLNPRDGTWHGGHLDLRKLWYKYTQWVVVVIACRK